MGLKFHLPRAPSPKQKWRKFSYGGSFLKPPFLFPSFLCTFPKLTPKPPTRQRVRVIGSYRDTRGEVRPVVINKTETKIASCEQMLCARNNVAPGCLPFYPLPRA